MEEYLKTLLEQVRCKKAHPAIEREIRGHIEEQRKKNREAGMEEEEAARLAILDMGDPVEAGVELDRIHKPRTAWDLIFVMALISLASFGIHLAIGLGAGEAGSFSQGGYILRAACFVGFGFLLMLLVCRLDYSVFARHARWMAGLFLAVMTFFVATGVVVNGQAAWMMEGGVRISLSYAMFLYVPLYGAVLYRYRGSGFGGLLQIFFFTGYPVWLALRIPRASLAVQMLLLLSAMLTVAVRKDWYLIPKKIFLGAYWGIVALAPCGLTFYLVKSTKLVPSYQQERIESFLNGTARDYVANLLSEYRAKCRLFGPSGMQVAGFLPEYNSDYILTFLSSCYGMAAAVLICLLVGFAAVRACRIAFRQSNQLGMMTGLGSGLALLLNTFLNMAENFGLLPRTATFLPFFSYSGTGMAVSYILIGIALSVYRHKDILPASARAAGKNKKRGPVSAP